MEAKGVVASLALHAVLEPIFMEMEREESLLASVQTLRDAFTKVERSHPGVTEDFLSGLLEAEGVTVNLPEALLQLACQDGDHYTIPSEEREYVQLNQRARALKLKLSHIPDQIQDRSQFLKIIRDIASAIKDVLDAVNEVSKKHHGDPRMREFKKMLDTHKKVFVKSSRSFSDTLKRYFRDGRSESVYLGANRLLNHTNALLVTSPPKLVSSTTHGKLLTVGDGDDLIHLLHVWGSPYEMGYAQGSLLRERAQDMLTGVWSYFELQVEQAINGTIDFLPSWFLKDVADVGLDVALDLEILATESYSGDYFLQEIKGLAYSSGVDYKKIQRIHMIGELTKGSCSMFGADSSATPDGSLLQLRALDWDVDGPFKNFPQITVYHPLPGNGHPFINIGWTGWIGSITGVSSQKLAISEIGVSFPDDTFGEESRFGIPFTYLLRDILQFDDSLQKAVKRISSAHRTCDLILGVGDGKENQFRGVEYSAAVADFFTWDNLRPEATWHPHIKDIVYWGMDWLCPGYSEVLAKQLSHYHGNITALNTIRDIVSIVQTGDLHVAIYDMSRDLLYVANARADNESGPTSAYDRTFIGLNISELFAEPAPTSYYLK